MFFAHSRTQPKWLSVCFSFPQGQMALVSFFSSSFLLLQRVPHALHHFSLREVKPLPSFGHFLINERAKRYCREIIVYSRSIINTYFPLSHKWWVLLIKFMVGPTIHVREVNMHLWYSESI